MPVFHYFITYSGRFFNLIIKIIKIPSEKPGLELVNRMLKELWIKGINSEPRKISKLDIV